MTQSSLQRLRRLCSDDSDFSLKSEEMCHFREHGKPQNSRTKKIFFKSALLILTVSTNAFQSTNLFCCFSRCQAPTNSVAPYFCTYTTQDPQFFDSLRRRANARNLSFRISLRWPIYIINPADKTKLSCYTSHRRSIRVSLESYPSIN